jgi:hypothetical protein
MLNDTGAMFVFYNFVPLLSAMDLNGFKIIKIFHMKLNQPSIVYKYYVFININCTSNILQFI